MQQDVTANGLNARAVEELQNCSFFFCKTNFFLRIINQHFGRWLEGVVPDFEHRIFTLLMLT